MTPTAQHTVSRTIAKRLSRPEPTDHSTSAWVLSAAMERMRIGLLIHDRTGRIISCNEAAHVMLGLTRGELEGRSAFDASWSVCDEMGRPLPAPERPALAVLRTGEPILGVVLGIRRPGGELRWYRVDSHPLRKDGALLASATTFDDITGEQQVRSYLAQAESRLERARAVGNVGLWEYDVTLDLVTADDGFSELAGRPVRNGLEWRAAVHPEDRDSVASGALEMTRGRRAGDATYRFQWPDGRIRWVASNAQVVETSPDGRATKVAGALVDVTELQKRSGELRQLLDFMTDGYYTLTTDWRFAFINRRACEMLGDSADKLHGGVLWDLFPDALGSAFEEHYRRAMGGEVVQFEAYYPAPLDSTYQIQAYPIPTGMAVQFRNVTAERQAAAERERLLREAREAQEHLAYRATHDVLTGLPNRVALVDWLQERLGRDVDRGRLWVMFVDLDRFKLVNDTYGHGQGDAVLEQAARRLLDATGPDDVVARLGGDEFIVALGDSDGRRASRIASAVLEVFRAPFELENRSLVLTASIGIAVGSERATAETLIRDADIALYKAKDSGRNQVAVFGSRLRREAWRRLGTESDLRDALSRDDIVAHYQPIYDLATGAVVSAEALARWTNTAGRTVPPDQFIPVAEECGLIIPLGQRILDEVSLALPSLEGALGNDRAIVWVNVSTRQLDEPFFVEEVVGWARERGLLGRVGLEITESVLGRNDALTHAAVESLARAGFLVAIDDFGTGYSSLSRLANYPVDLIKIDRSFVRNLGTDTGARIVRTIVELTHSLGAHACAEGVESDEELEVLRRLGVDRVSGFRLCPPRPLPQLADAARAGTDLLRSVCRIPRAS